MFALVTSGRDHWNWFVSCCWAGAHMGKLPPPKECKIKEQDEQEE